MGGMKDRDSTRGQGWCEGNGDGVRQQGWPEGTGIRQGNWKGVQGMERYEGTCFSTHPPCGA